MERIRVLLVEDDPTFRMVLRSMFHGDERFEVIAEAKDGAPGVELAKLHQPDVVILDIGLPGMSGLRAIPLIKEVAPVARIIVLTAYDGMAEAAKLRGADHVIAKINRGRLTLDLVIAALSGDA